MSFIRQFRKLEETLQEEIVDKIELFKNPKNHVLLKVHSLKGPLKGYYSFSVNYKFRIIFQFRKGKQEAHLHIIGDHSVYQ